ncbi:TetR/AcrR family transcriptional regulator [Microbacterium paludicola]|uniref:TetR/AcrR family transcriptional regulator n=1 Tax=Microbacterium paludicola TaxID=300019 RepID=UPI0011A84CB2|nr:TetR/AcrR family transcriptional regulator [Microbacterium paludicola]
MPTTPQPARRSDSQRNRDTILSVAQELLSENAATSLSEIARRSGVGPATLYRHFPDRRALLTALSQDNLEELEQAVASVPEDDPDRFEHVLVQVSLTLARCAPLTRILLDERLTSAGTAAAVRVESLFEPVLRQSQSLGTVRRDAETSDVMFVLNMIQAAIATADDATGRTAAARRAVRVVLPSFLAPPGE